MIHKYFIFNLVLLVYFMTITKEMKSNWTNEKRTKFYVNGFYDKVNMNKIKSLVS